jgi:hypothetical protein
MMIGKRFQPFLGQQRCIVTASHHANKMALDNIRCLTRNRVMPVRFFKGGPSSVVATLSSRHYSTTTVFRAAVAKHGDDDDYLKAVYCAKAAQDGLKQDPIQLHALKSLDRLRRELKQVKPPMQILEASRKTQSVSNSSSWSSWFGASANKEATKNTNSIKKDAPMPQLPKGCYLHGGEFNPDHAEKYIVPSFVLTLFMLSFTTV